MRIRNETKKTPINEKFAEEISKNQNIPSLQFESNINLNIKNMSNNNTLSTKSKVPLLNLNVGLKGINSQENNLPQKNINISEINNESVADKNDLSGGSGSFNKTILVKQIDYNPEEKSKYLIKLPDNNKGKSPQNLSFLKKTPILDDFNQVTKPEVASPNFPKKIAGKVFMPKLNLKGDKLETSKIGETPFDLRSMIINAEKKQTLRNERFYNN